MHPEDGEPLLDEPLLDELRAAAEVHDPVPDRVVAAANAAYTFRTFEAELAALVFDSHEPQAGHLVRGTATPRVLSFRSAAGGLELEIAREAGGLRLIGQLSPVRAIGIELSTPEATTTITSDELGRFAARVSPPRPFLLRFESVTTGWVTTEWISP